MANSDREMPAVLKRLNQLDFDYADGEGIDFEPFAEFLSAEDTTGWFRAWTGNGSLDGGDYLVFGQDGSGGYAALWCVRPELPLTDQPIVFMGSEGELGVVARNLNDYLWMLASNLGPYEAVSYPDSEGAVNSQFTAFAKANSASPPMTPQEILSRAREAFPDFERKIEALIR